MPLLGLLLLSVFFADASFAADASSSNRPAVEAPTSGGAFIEPLTGMAFACLQGGTFEMGDTFGDGDADEKPVHRVTVWDFCLGKTEVTQAQWEKVMGSNPSKFKGRDRPVEQVSWNDAQEFLRKLSEGSGKTFRLPTEAEWEYAARSGGESEKWAGVSSESELGDYAWYDQNSGGQTRPVATKKPNGLGLYDLSGNVWEWVQDWKGGYPSGAQNNPTGPSSGSGRVIRGGGWRAGAGLTRSAKRLADGPGDRGSVLGFRVVTEQ